ncbi:hypothetical protein ES708_29091 [subsurface metagenome]
MIQLASQSRLLTILMIVMQVLINRTPMVGKSGYGTIKVVVQVPMI